jgi:hypothetical protein
VDGIVDVDEARPPRPAFERRQRRDHFALQQRDIGAPAGGELG